MAQNRTQNQTEATPESIRPDITLVNSPTDREAIIDAKVALMMFSESATANGKKDR